MRIGLVGGLDRNEWSYKQMAREAGHEVEFHTGHVGARGNISLENLINRVDMLIIATDVNSHGAVLLARRLVRARGIALTIVRRCGPSRFLELLATLDRPAAAAG
ncbi:MAG TPA: DUF2325 domain-containing protein [Polyangia bacterium]|jgi:hypothetical protein|nr:DUF2325 domain-containing protein [Polyangia bacterium]